MGCTRRNLAAGTVLGVALSFVSVAEADPAGTRPAGRNCGFSAVSDPGAQAPPDAMTGEITGGPMLWDRDYWLHCRLQVNSNVHNGSANDEVAARAPSSPHDGDSEMDEIATLAEPIGYTSGEADQAYLCTSVSWPTATGPNWLYWDPTADGPDEVPGMDLGTGDWTTSPSRPCSGTGSSLDPEPCVTTPATDGLSRGSQPQAEEPSCVRCDVTLELQGFDLQGWDEGDPFTDDESPADVRWLIETRSGSNVPDFWTEFAGGDAWVPGTAFTGKVSSGPRSRVFERQPDGSYQRHVNLGASTVEELDSMGDNDPGSWFGTWLDGDGDDDLQIECVPNGGLTNNPHTLRALSLLTVAPPDGQPGEWSAFVSWNWIVTSPAA